MQGLPVDIGEGLLIILVVFLLGYVMGRMGK